jgi:hypothetical protein
MIPSKNKILINHHNHENLRSFSPIKKPHHYNAAIAQTLVFVVSEVSAKNFNV